MTAVSNLESGEAPTEMIFSGVPVSQGISIGQAYLFAPDPLESVDSKIGEEDVERECSRFESAVQRSEKQLQKIGALSRERIGEKSAAIFEAQLLMLRDPALHEGVVEAVKGRLINAESAVSMVVDGFKIRLQGSENEYLRERANDFSDIQNRLIRNLQRGVIVSKIDPDRIVVAQQLTAADIILFSRRDIRGCAMDFGGATSHVSIMARALDVPAVSGLHEASQHVWGGETLILDGLAGVLIVNPEESTLAEYQERQRAYQVLVESRSGLSDKMAETKDGHAIQLMANLEFHEELPLLKENDAHGIGLFRTEILFLSKGRFADEEEQFSDYKAIVEGASPEPVNIRLLDMGGDKLSPMGHREQNPFLGWRGIRILLDQPEVLRPQLRAILRASAFGNVRILIPMITSLSEVLKFKDLMKREIETLKSEGHMVAEGIPVGIMIEVPSVALLAERFVDHVDFFSIGTNDLTQYLLAVDRGNDLVGNLYDEYHPSVLATIGQIIDVGKRNGVEVSICGEMAADPMATAILVGLGLRQFSASPTYLPDLKRVIRRIDEEEARQLAKEALALSDPLEVHTLVDEWMSSRDEELAALAARKRDQHHNKNQDS